MNRCIFVFSALAGLLACTGRSQTTFDQHTAVAAFQKQGDKLDADYETAMSKIVIDSPKKAAVALGITETYCQNIRELYARQDAVLAANGIRLHPVALEQHKAVIATCTASLDVFAYLAAERRLNASTYNNAGYQKKLAVLDAASKRLDKANAAFEAGKAKEER